LSGRNHGTFLDESHGSPTLPMPSTTQIDLRDTFIREERTALKAKSEELDDWLTDQNNKISSAERIPAEIKSFLEDFQGLDIRVEKAHLQTILKSAHVHRDRSIEVEFRG